MTITDSFGCTENIDFENDYFIILPLLKDDLNASLKANNQEIELSWSSNPGIGMGYYGVERALHDISSFNVVGTLPINDNSEEFSNYIFTDSNLPRFPSRIYYRVKQVPDTGKPLYGSTIMIEIPALHHEKKWSAFPNPFENNLQLFHQGNPIPSDAKIFIKIYSPSSIFHKQLSTNENTVNLSDVIKSAPKGLLIIEIKYLDKVELVKVIKK